MPRMTARDFNRDVNAAQRAADDAPLVITDRDEPAHVLLSIGEFPRLSANGPPLVDRLSMDDDIDIDVGPLRLTIPVPDL